MIILIAQLCISNGAKHVFVICIVYTAHISTARCKQAVKIDSSLLEEARPASMIVLFLINILCYYLLEFLSDRPDCDRVFSAQASLKNEQVARIYPQ